MTTAEAAIYLMYTKQHILHLICTGELKAVRQPGKGRPWLIDDESVREWKAKNTNAERKKKIGSTSS
jgi:excisionase family DNA binding protein